MIQAKPGGDGIPIPRMALQRTAPHVLWGAFDESTDHVLSAMAADRPLRIELIETLNVGSDTAVAPDLFALDVQRRTDAVETVTVVGARRTVLLVNVRRTVARLAVAVFGQVAIVGYLATRVAALAQLAILAARPFGAFRLFGQLARDRIAARVDG